MARKLEKTVQRAGVGAWLSRRVTGLFGKTRAVLPARERRSVAVDLHTDQLRDSAETEEENSVLGFYFSMVFVGALLFGYLAGTDSVLAKGAAVVAVFANLSVFVLLFPKGWERDLRFSAFLLSVVAPTAYVTASLFGFCPNLGSQRKHCWF